MLRDVFYAILAVIVIGMALELAEPSIVSYINRSTVAEKVGRVVDVTTGQGVEGAIVVFNLTEEGGGVSGSSGGCQKQQIVETDANGAFALPSLASEVEFPRLWWKQMIAPIAGMPKPYVEYSWHVVAFKPGFVRVGDDALIHNATAADHQPDRSFPWYWQPPPSTVVDGVVRIDPISLHPALLSPIDSMVYMYSLYMRASCGAKNNLPAFKAVKSNMGQVAAAEVCALPEAQAVPPNVIRALASLSGDQHFLDSMHSFSGTDLWPRRSEPAGQLCTSLNE